MDYTEKMLQKVIYEFKNMDRDEYEKIYQSAIKKRERTMKFGFDIDDTIVETYPILEQKAKEFYNIILPHPKNFKVLQDNIEQNKLKELIEYCFNDLSLMKRNENCINFIKHLVENDIQKDIPFVTARPYHLKEKTKEMLENILLDVNCKFNLRICKNSKVKDVKEEGITHYIEDRWKYAKELADNGTKVFLKLKPWNKHSRGLCHPNIIPFRNYEYIKYKTGIK